MDDYIISRKISSNRKNNLALKKYIIKFLILVILTLSLLISLKVSTKFKMVFYKNIYEKSFPFATVNNYYQKLFGSPIPFKDLFKTESEVVFNEKIKYSTVSKYYDGVALTVPNNLLVPVIETGMVVFVGEKENFGKTVIIEQVDGVDLWYGNLENINVKMYDYIEKGMALGNVSSDKLYLVFKKDGEVINYETYL